MNNQLSTPLYKRILDQTKSLSTIYEGRRGKVTSLKDPLFREYLKEKRKFDVENLLPIGWVLLKVDETTNGHSLESFLNYWFVQEWGGKGPVSARRDTKFPYNEHKLTFLLENVFQVFKVDNDTFIQINNKNDIKVITGLSHQLMSYFSYLYYLTDEYGIHCKIFQQVFDVHFWRSKDIQKNPQFTKRIDLSDVSWNSYLRDRNLQGDSITKTYMSKLSSGYKFRNYVITENQRSAGEQEFLYNLQNLLEKYSLSGVLLTNKEVYSIMEEYSKYNPLKTKNEMSSVFHKLSFKMGYDVIPKRRKVNSKTTRGHLIQKSVQSNITGKYEK